MKTIEILSRLAKARGLGSDYAVAKYLGISRSRMSKYRCGHDTLGADLAIKIADDLGLDRGYVLASIAAERASQGDERRTWEQVARRLATAAVLLVAVGAFDITEIAYTHAADFDEPVILIMSAALALIAWLASRRTGRRARRSFGPIPTP